MRRHAPLVWHAATAVLIGVILLWLTYGFVVLAEGPVFSWQRDFVLAGGYVEAHVYHIMMLIGLTALAACAWRVLELAGWRAPRPGVAATANVLAGLMWTCVIILTLRFQPWNAIFAEASDGPVLSADSDLDYPALPLGPVEKDPEWILTSAKGDTVSIKDFEGKAVFLNVWATWCGWCIYEFPSIEDLHASLKDNPNIAFVIVSEEPPDIVNAWLDENDYTLPFYTTESFPKEFTPRGYPTTFFIAPDGRVAFEHSGALNWDGDRTRDFLIQLAES